MSKKAPVPLRIAPFQYVVAEPITDPAEQAAIDEMRKRLQRKKGGQKAKTNRKDAIPASDAD